MICFFYDQTHELSHFSLMNRLRRMVASDSDHYDQIARGDDNSILAEMTFKPEAAWWKDIFGAITGSGRVTGPPQVTVASGLGIRPWSGQKLFRKWSLAC